MRPLKPRAGNRAATCAGWSKTRPAECSPLLVLWLELARVRSSKVGLPAFARKEAGRSFVGAGPGGLTAGSRNRDQPCRFWPPL